jgi:CRP/FNR family cyclic AMP-dependent transcriptional regulator
VGPSVDVRAALARSYLLEGLPPEALDPVLPHIRIRRLVRDEALFHAGDAADELYVVVDGAVKDSVITMEGEEVVHFVHGAGNTLGEPGFFSVERDRIVSVRATRATTLVVLERPVVERLMADHPALKDKALERLAGQARFQTSMIAALATRPLEHRLLLRVLELAEGGDGDSTTP